MSLKKAAILVSVTLSKDRNNSVAHCLESQELLAAAGYECVFIVKLTQSHVNSASYLSAVHAGYIKDVAACIKPHLIVIDQTLKPGHLFTLQRLISGRLMVSPPEIAWVRWGIFSDFGP